MLNETMEQRDPCAVLGLPISLEETDTDVQNSTHMGLQLRRSCANNHRFGASTLWGSSCKLSIGFPPPSPSLKTEFFHSTIPMQTALSEVASANLCEIPTAITRVFTRFLIIDTSLREPFLRQPNSSSDSSPFKGDL